MKELGRGAWGMITNCECVWIGNVRLWYCPDEFTLMIDVPRNLDEAWRSYLALFFFPVSCEDQALAVEMQTLRYEGQGVEDIPLLLEMIRSFAQQVPIRRLAIVC